MALFEADMAARGWNATTLAGECGVSIATISRFLRGTNRTPKTAKRMALALGYPVSRYVKNPRGEAVAA